MPLPVDESKPYPAAPHRYQLTVMATSMVDVVRCAGGWLCDRARAGWDVNVLVVGDCDTRALAILGVRDVDGEFAVTADGPLAVSAELLATDDRVREDVLDIVKRGLVDVTVFGRESPADLGHKVERVEHTLSSAARAFKGHAIAAANSTSRVADTETLFWLGTESLRPLHSV